MYTRPPPCRIHYIILGEGQEQEAEEEASLPGLLPCTPGLLPAGYTILF
jgi:hypothetical protein